MSKCGKARGVMGAYIYGELPPDEMKMVRTHLEACPSCHEEMKAQATAVGQIPTDSPPLSGIDRERIFWSVQGGIHREARPDRQSSGLIRALYGLGATVAVASLLVVGILIGYNYTSRTTGQSESVPGAEPLRQEEAADPMAPARETIVPTTVPAPQPPPAYVPPTPEPIAAPAPVTRASDPLPNRSGNQNVNRIHSRPQILKENEAGVQQNHVEAGIDSSTDSEKTESRSEADTPSATTAPAPAGMDDVRETPLSEGETSTR